MSFLDKVFRWKKKPFGEGGKPAQTSAPQKFQSGKDKMDKAESHGTGKYAHVLLRPHTSEKAVSQGAQNQYVFEVAPQSSKDQVVSAIGDLYGIVPEQVNIVNMGGKQTRFGKTQGATKSWKKAIITLPSGKTIDVYKK